MWPFPCMTVLAVTSCGGRSSKVLYPVLQCVVVCPVLQCVVVWCDVVCLRHWDVMLCMLLLLLLFDMRRSGVVWNNTAIPPRCAVLFC